MYRESQTGIKHFEKGDAVTIGKGKTVWDIFHIFGGVAHLKSRTSGIKKVVEEGEIALFLNVRDTDEWKEANEAKEEPVKETSAYAKAVLFALNKLQKHVYAGTVSEKTKGKRRGLGRRQKASRKANR